MININSWKDFFTVIKRDSRLQVIIAISILLCCELTSFLTFKMLGITNIPLPGSFLFYLIRGNVIPIICSFIVSVAIITTVYLWFLGGEKRTIANYIVAIVLGLVGFSWLGVYCYVYWQNLDITPYPWLVYTLLTIIPKGSNAYYHLLLCLIGSYSLLFLALFTKLFSAKTNAEKVFGKAHFAGSFEIKKAGLFTNTGIILGKAFGKILRLSGFESVLITAPTGSGKTTSIAIPNLIEWQGSVVVNDLKGELYRLTSRYRQEHLGNKCFIWAPSDETMQTHKYNPFFYVSRNPDLRIRDLQLIAEILIPGQQSNDAFWYQSSREIFIMLALYLFETQGTATLAEINDLSKRGDFFLWLKEIIEEQEDKISTIVLQSAASLVNTDEKTQRNILKDFHSRISLFIDPILRNAISDNDFDFRNLRKEKHSIYIKISDADSERLRPILTLFWAQLINIMTQIEPKIKDESLPVLGLMDEFGNMARIRSLQAGISFLRAYRMRCIIIVQHLSQIVSVYGRNDAKNFLNSKIKMAFALNDIDDARFFSNAMGQKTVRVKSSSVNTGHGDNSGGRSENLSYQSRALMTPDEIMQMKGNQEIILVEGQSPVKAKKVYWFKDRAYKKLLKIYIKDRN